MTRPATLDEVLRVLREKQPEAWALGIELVSVVGSLARGEARPDSDVDVIVRTVGRPTLFTISRLEESLGGAVGRPVDLVFREALGPERRSYIERDLVAL